MVYVVGQIESKQGWSVDMCRKALGNGESRDP